MVGLVDSTKYYVNYGVDSLSMLARTISTNPSAVKKSCQVTYKMIAIWDYFTGEVHGAEFVRSLKGAVDLVNFYATFKNIIYWVNPFTKESLDRNVLRLTLEAALESHLTSDEKESNSILASTVIEDVLHQAGFHNAKDVTVAIQESLKRQGVEDAPRASKIAQDVVVQQKPREFTEVVMMLCFTVADLGENITTLKKWGVVDSTLYAAQVALKVGSESKVFMFVYEAGADTVLGTIASVGLLISVGRTSYKMYYVVTEYMKEGDPDRKRQQYKEIRGLMLELLATGLDLGCTAAPLLYHFSPPALLAMAVVSKGVGLVVLLIR